MKTIRERLNLLEPSPEGCMGLPVYFQGLLTHALLHSIADLTEVILSPMHLKLKVTRRVHHISVELLQNALRHRIDEPGNPWNGTAMYSLDMHEGALRIVVANLVENEQIDIIGEMLEALNACTIDEQKDRFMTQLLLGKLSEKGGAGLGLIDIARKSQGPLQWGAIDSGGGREVSLFYVCAHIATE